jgi:DNA polymerase
MIVRAADVEPATPPPTRDLAALRTAAAACTACPLFRNATQTVWGEGPSDATIVLVGEQPGDDEDRAGRPFVGPAGRLLDRALADAGIARSRCWVTNAVKHFKWTPRGKRRIHERPSAREIAACRPWLEAEIASLAPDVVVCLGATAVASVLGPRVRVMRDRGKVFPSAFAGRTLVTIHPSAILRAPDVDARRAAYADFIADLALVAGRRRRRPPDAEHAPRPRMTAAATTPRLRRSSR